MRSKARRCSGIHMCAHAAEAPSRGMRFQAHHTFTWTRNGLAGCHISGVLLSHGSLCALSWPNDGRIDNRHPGARAWGLSGRPGSDPRYGRVHGGVPRWFLVFFRAVPATQVTAAEEHEHEDDNDAHEHHPFECHRGKKRFLAFFLISSSLMPPPPCCRVEPLRVPPGAAHA